MDAEFIEIKNLAEKEVARRRKTAVKVLTEYNDFLGGWGGFNLVAGDVPGDVGGNEPGALELLELPGGDCGSAPVGGDGLL